MMIRSLVTVIALVLLSGCAALDMRRDVPSSAVASIRSIGVVSSLGPEFHATFVGTTIFKNKEHKFSVPHWEVDEFAIETAIEYLNSSGRYEAKSLGSSYGERNYEKMLGAARSAGHDTLIVLTPSTSDNQPHYEGGYGLFRRSFLGNRDDCIYSLFVSQAFDVVTGKKHAWEWSYPTMTGIPCYGKKKRGEPWNNKIDWRDALDGYTDEEQEILRRNVLESISESVARSLKGLGL